MVNNKPENQDLRCSKSGSGRKLTLGLNRLRKRGSKRSKTRGLDRIRKRMSTGRIGKSGERKQETPRGRQVY
jgi:hypothetical protein